MAPRAEIVHWLFATGFLLLGLLLLAESIVGPAVWRRRRWRVYLWPSLAFALGVLLWPVAVFFTSSTLHMLAHTVWAEVAILAGAVSDYFDFLAARPNFIRLIEREALNGGPPHDELGHLSAGQEALAAISAELGLDDSPSGEAAQLLLSVIALCWFHLIHARTVAPAVGVSLEDAEDLERRRRHVVGLVLRGVAGLDRPLTSTLTRSTDHD